LQAKANLFLKEIKITARS